ncbi:MAG: hypothetical protein AB1640_07010 [bacterium]
MRRIRFLVPAAAFAFALAACGDSDEAGTPSAPDSLVQFAFGLHGQPLGSSRFVAATGDAMVLEKARGELALPAFQRRLHIHGPLASGDGDHNQGWSWHFVPGEWDLVELSIELCDGTPRYVEDHLDEWVGQTFCPWSSYVLEELDAG